LSDPSSSKVAGNTGPDLAVKGVGGPMRGPLRSPLLAGAAAQVDAKGAAAGVQPAAKPGAQHEVSAIAGLDDSRNNSLMATALSHHMFDSTRDTQKKSFKLVLIALPVALALAFAFVPDFRTRAIKAFESAKSSIVGLVRPPRKVKTKKRRAASYAAPSPDGVAARREAPAPGLVNPKGSCGSLTKSVSASDPRLRVEERIAVAECFLVLDNPQSAEEMLSPLKRKIVGSSEADLNAQKSTGTLADAHQLLVVAYLKMAKSREADELLRGRCPRWEQTNTCVAKLLVHVDRRYDAAPLKSLFETRGRLDRKAQARLWYAGAQLALQDDRPAVADQRYTMAFAAAPKEAMALRKQIYELQAVDLYHRGEVIRLKSLVATAQSDLGRLDPKSKIKLGVLGELVSSPDKRRTVKKLLTREDVTFRARGDLDLIDVLGPESMRFGLESDYLRLLSRTRTHYGERFRASASALRRLSMWEIRSSISQKSYDAALQLLARHETSFGKEPAAHHLRGLVYLLQDPSPKYALLAASEFQQAVRSKGKWESLYALGITLIRAGQAPQVPAVIKDLERTVATPGQRFWTDMLKAQWYVAVGKLVNAAKLLQDWTRKEPGYSVPRELLMDVFGKMGNKTGAEEQERVLDDLRRRQPGGQTPEAFASPLGVLAYERRPIN
jgi:hypothetical protein